MDIFYRLRDIEFVWNPDKATGNLQKHGVTFEEAAAVFFDPFYQTGDASVDEVEQRNFIIGYSSLQRVLLVVYTERGPSTRIISARSATRTERKAYESTNKWL